MRTINSRLCSGCRLSNPSFCLVGSGPKYGINPKSSGCRLSDPFPFCLVGSRPKYGINPEKLLFSFWVIESHWAIARGVWKCFFLASMEKQGSRARCKQHRDLAPCALFGVYGARGFSVTSSCCMWAAAWQSVGDEL